MELEIWETEKGWEEEFSEWKGKTLSWKITSLETKYWWVCRSRSLYPFTPGGYPKKTQAVALGSNLVLWLERLEAYQRQPNTLRWE